MSEQFTCKTCVLDRTAQEIEFTETGCTFCDLARKMQPHGDFPPKDLKTDNEYDVLLGLSGGVDSSYCLHLLIEMGLRPLCFSVDNGWNDPKADENIMRMVEGLKVPFYRYTIDQKKFLELQGAFMKAGLVNVEIPTDHILMATSLELASKYNIKTIISGGNWATESIMPKSWSYPARDLVHIKDVYTKMTGKRLTGLPVCGLLKWNYYKWIRGIRTINLLDYFHYHRGRAIELLQDKYGWKDYGEKHCESIFTWWFQNYYLYERFGIDKRKAHLSSLVVSGQMTRQDALEILKSNPVYPEIGLEQKVLKYPKRSHYDFKTDERRFNRISKLVKLCRF